MIIHNPFVTQNNSYPYGIILIWLLNALMHLKYLIYISLIYIQLFIIINHFILNLREL